MKYIVALDQGTTSSRAILFDESQNIIGVAQKEFTQIYPNEGWVEHDPMEIWASQSGVLSEVIARAGISQHDIIALGITNQRETTIVWDKNTGKPLLNSNNEKIKSEKTFVANASNGEIDIEFKVEKSIARGKSIVVFEDCYYENVKIASHSDIKDKNQTVHFENKRVKEENHKHKITSQNNRVKTGDKSTIWKYVILLISAQLLLAFILLSKFLKKNMA